MFDQQAKKIGMLVSHENSALKNIEVAARAVKAADDDLWRKNDALLESIMHRAGYCMVVEADTLPSGPRECSVCILCGYKAWSEDEVVELARMCKNAAAVRVNKLSDLKNWQATLAATRRAIAAASGE